MSDLEFNSNILCTEGCKKQNTVRRMVFKSFRELLECSHEEQNIKDYKNFFIQLESRYTNASV